MKFKNTGTFEKEYLTQNLLETKEDQFTSPLYLLRKLIMEANLEESLLTHLGRLTSVLLLSIALLVLREAY